jgi:hypothetical protein
MSLIGCCRSTSSGCEVGLGVGLANGYTAIRLYGPLTRQCLGFRNAFPNSRWHVSQRASREEPPLTLSARSTLPTGMKGAQTMSKVAPPPHAAPPHPASGGWAGIQNSKLKTAPRHLRRTRPTRRKRPNVQSRGRVSGNSKLKIQNSKLPQAPSHKKAPRFRGARTEMMRNALKLSRSDSGRNP